MKKLIPEIIVPVEGQTESWCHLAPIGEFSYRTPTESDPNATGTQLLDKQALENLVKVFSDSVLVDREHLSIVGDETTAMGWIEALELRADGLYARIRWTDLGLDNIRNRRLRWLSPVWELDSDNRPLALDSAGLTNTARFKNNLNPVVNKTDDQTKTQGKDKPAMDWTIVTTALGLAADAHPEQAAAAIAALQDQLTTAVNKAEEAEEKALNTEGEKLADENEEKIANKAAFIKAYVANKAAALACLQAIKAPEKQPVVNKADAQKPSFMNPGSKVLNKLQQFNAMSEGAAKHNFFMANKAELLELEQNTLKQG